MIESNINPNYECDDSVINYIQNSLKKRGNKMNKYEKAIKKEEETLRRLYKASNDMYYLAQYQEILTLEVQLDMISYGELDKKVEELKEVK